MTQGGTDHTSHRLVYYGLSETRAVALLALIGIALGATAVAYNVLDRPAVTALGILVTFALLVQFGSFLAELSEDERRGRPGDTSLRHAITVQPRRLAELVVDAAMVCGTFLASYLLLVDGRGTELQRGTFLAVLPVLLGTTYVVYVLFARLPPRMALRDPAGSRHDRRSRPSSRRSRHTASSSRPAISVTSHARAFAVYGVAAASLALASRWLVRFVPEAGGGPDDGRRRVLVVGAGSAGRGLVRDLRRADDAHVVGFLDDNPRLRRRRVQGVAGARDDGRRSSRARDEPCRRARGDDPGRARRAARPRRAGLRHGGRPVPSRSRGRDARVPADPGRRGVNAATTAAPSPRASSGRCRSSRRRYRSSARTSCSRRCTHGRRGAARRRRSSRTSSS